MLCSIGWRPIIFQLQAGVKYIGVLLSSLSFSLQQLNTDHRHHHDSSLYRSCPRLQTFHPRRKPTYYCVFSQMDYNLVTYFREQPSQDVLHHKKLKSCQKSRRSLHARRFTTQIATQDSFLETVTKRRK